MRLLFYLVVLSFFLSCRKDPAGSDFMRHPQTVLNGIFVLNEGNFGQENGSLSFYDPEENEIYNNVFQDVNKRNLGSIAQSIAFLDSIAIIVVNGSDRLEVIHTRTFKSIRTVNLPVGSSPKYITCYNKEKAYITNLYTNTCSVLDLKNWEITKEIPVGANPEGIAIAGNKVFVANSGFGYGNTVSVINTALDEVIATIRVSDNPVSAETMNDRIYILCSGSYGQDLYNPEDDSPGAIFCIDPETNIKLDSILIEGHPSKLATDGDRMGIFLTQGGLMRFNAEKMTIEDSLMIKAPVSEVFYGVAWDPVTKNIHVLNAKDFTQQGQMLIYDTNGVKLREKTVGIIPGTIGFYYE